MDMTLGAEAEGSSPTMECFTVNFFSHLDEDLKVLKLSPEIGSQDLNNVKLRQGPPRLIITYLILFYHIWVFCGSFYFFRHAPTFPRLNQY